MLKNKCIGCFFYFCVSFNLLLGNIPKQLNENELVESLASRDAAASVHIKSCSKCDYIVVGNGTAGAVLARKLSDNHHNKVFCIEIGRNRTEDPFVLTPNVFDPTTLNELTYNPKYSVNYPFTVPTPGQALPYSEGRMWGGSSAHNYLVAVRGTPLIYNAWASLTGNNRWTYNNLLDLMKSIETYTPNGTTIDLTQRGTSGPIFITQTPPVTADPLAIGFSLGTSTPLVADYNNINEGSVGISATQEFITPGANPQRSYSQPAYLQVGTIIDAEGNGLKGRRLKVVSAAFVSRVLFRGNKAIGVEYIENVGTQDEAIVRVFAKKKVILCAGAINSPAILQRSGVGDAALLNSLSIPVIVDSPNVGKNLINQYGPIGVLINAQASDAVGFIDGTPFFPNDGQRRIQLGSLFFGPTTVGIYGFNLESRSRGSVTIVDTNPFIQPKLDLNMYSDTGNVHDTNGYDAQIAISFYKLLLTISANIPGSIVVYPPPADYSSDAALLADAQNISTSLVTSHIAATTRMGDSIANGVVNGNLHVFGTRNLMVADLGIAPVITDGNTCFPVYVIGNVAAEIIASGAE